VKSPTARTCSYGLDSRGRVVVDRQPAHGEDEPAFDEFFIHHKNGIESAAYGRGKSHPLQYVTRQVLRGGRPVVTDVLDASTPASFSEHYRYDARGRLVEIRVTSVDGQRKDKVKYDVVYETDGRLRAVRRYYDYLPIPCPVYWNPATIPSLQAIEDAMRKKLVDAIPKAIRKAKVKGPAYCVAIVYDTENEELPPLIGIGLDSERRKWLAEDPKGAKSMIWNPGDFERYEPGKIDLVAPGLEEESHQILQLVFMKTALHVPQRLLNAVATELNKRSWKGILSVTDDFVAFAVDLEGEDFMKNMKDGVPERKRKLLRSRKLL
jgi:YD repeat-containing protein